MTERLFASQVLKQYMPLITKNIELGIYPESFQELANNNKEFTEWLLKMEEKSPHGSLNFLQILMMLPLFGFYLSQLEKKKAASEHLLDMIHRMKADKQIFQEYVSDSAEDAEMWESLIQSAEVRFANLDGQITNFLPLMYQLSKVEVKDEILLKSLARDFQEETYASFASAFISRIKSDNNHHAIFASKVLVYSCNALFGNPNLRSVTNIVNTLYHTDYNEKNIQRHWQKVRELNVRLPLNLAEILEG